MATFLELLNSGPQLGLGIFYPASGIIERLGPDWDWIWIDGQHGELAYADVLAAVRASNLVKKPCVVRVPGHEAGLIGKALDTATDAVMVPMVENAKQAKAIVEAAKFPPLGCRSYGARRLIDLHGRAYAHSDRPHPLLVCQIETEPGLKNAASIAAVEGVDALFFGPDDMSLRFGLPMDQPRPKGYLDQALKTVADAAKANGKICGGVFGTPESLSAAVELGYMLNVGTADSSILANGSKEIATSLRQSLAPTKAKDANSTSDEQEVY